MFLFCVVARRIIRASPKLSEASLSADHESTTSRASLVLGHNRGMRHGVVALGKVSAAYEVFVASLVFPYHKVTGLAPGTGNPFLGSILARTIRYEYRLRGYKLLKEFRGLLFIDHYITAILGSGKSHI